MPSRTKGRKSIDINVALDDNAFKKFKQTVSEFETQIENIGTNFDESDYLKMRESWTDIQKTLSETEDGSDKLIASQLAEYRKAVEDLLSNHKTALDKIIVKFQGVDAPSVGFDEIFSDANKDLVPEFTGIKDSVAETKAQYDGIVKDTEEIIKNMDDAKNSAANTKVSYDDIVKDTEQIAKNMKEAKDSAADTTDARSFSATRNDDLEKEKELTEAIVQGRAELLNLNKQKIEKTGDSDEDEFSRQQKLLERDQKRLEIMERLVQLQKDYDALDIKESDRQQFPVDDIPKTYRTGMDMTSLDSSIRSMRGTITKRTNELKAIQRRIEGKQTETVQETLDETEKHIADGLEEVQNATPVVADTKLEEDKGKLTSHTEEVERAQDQIQVQQEKVIEDVVDETVEAAKESLQEIKKQKPKKKRTSKKKEQAEQISMFEEDEKVVPVEAEVNQTKVAADASLPSVTENYQEVAAAADKAEQAIEETTSAVKEQGVVIAEAEQKIENLTQESKELAAAQKEANTQDAEAVVQDLKVSDTVDELKKEDNIVDQVKKAFQEATKAKSEFADANVFVKDVAEETVKGLDAEKSAVQLLKEAFEQGTTAKEEFRKKNEELKKVAEDTTKQLEAEAQAAQQVRNNMNLPPNQPQNPPPNNPVNPLPPTNFKNDQTITNYIIDDNGGRQEYSQTRVSSRVGSNAYITRRENYLWDNDQSAWVPTTLQERENRARYVNESGKITEKLRRAQVTRDKYLADFQRKTQNNQNVFGTDYNAVVNAPLRQDNATDDINNLLNLMDVLDTRYNTIVSNFQRGTSTLNPFVNAIAGANTLENRIDILERQLYDLDDPSAELLGQVSALRPDLNALQAVDFTDSSFSIETYSQSFGDLRTKINAATQAMTLAKKTEKQVYGRTQYKAASKKYDQTQGQLYDLGIDVTDLQAVTDYTNSMQKLREAYNILRNAEDPTDDQKMSFNTLLQGAVNAQKSVQAIIAEEQKLLQQTRALNMEPIQFDVDANGIEAAQQAVSNELSKSFNVQHIGEYDKAHKSFQVTAKGTDGILRNFTITVGQNNKVLYLGEAQLDKNADLVEIFGNKIVTAGSKVAGFAKRFIGFEELFQQFRKGVDYVREIDVALTELKKVTDETEGTYSRFLQTASETGKKIGATVSDFTSSTADFARLGYTLDEATEMATAAQVLMNVSEFTDISNATDTLISAMQANNCLCVQKYAQRTHLNPVIPKALLLQCG